MELGLITTLLGVILTGIFSQTVAMWVKFNNLERKISDNKCPFGQCPLYERAKNEAVQDRTVTDIQPKMIPT